MIRLPFFFFFFLFAFPSDATLCDQGCGWYVMVGYLDIACRYSSAYGRTLPIQERGDGRAPSTPLPPFHSSVCIACTLYEYVEVVTS